MRKKLSIIGVSIAALAAFVVPSAASASVWGPAGTTQSFDAVGKYLSPGGSGNDYWTCKEHYTVDVRSPLSSTLDVKNVTYSNCEGFNYFAFCHNYTAKAEKLPWTINGVLSSSSSLNVGQMAFTEHCTGEEQTLYVSGTAGSGKWNSTAHSLTFSSQGLVMKGGGNTGSVLYSGTLADPLKALTLS